MKFLPPLILIVVVMPFASICQSPPSTPAVYDTIRAEQTLDFQSKVLSVDSRIARWNQRANVELASTIAIAVFGALIAGLHSMNNNWSRYSVLAMATSIGILTALLNTPLFPADYRTLERAVDSASEISFHLNNELSVYKKAQNPVDFKPIADEFTKRALAFDALEYQIEGGTKPPNDSAGPGEAAVATATFLTTVSAQSTITRPGWIDNPPADETYAYLVGTGIASSLTDAKTSSYSNAMSAALEYCGQRLPYQPDPIKTALIRVNASVQDDFLAYDGATYTYYTLMRIDRKFRPNWKPVTFRQRSWRPIDLGYDAVSGLFALDDNGKVSRVSFENGTIHLDSIFALNRSDRPASIAVNHEQIFVSSNNGTNCIVYRYSLVNDSISQDNIAVGQGGCDGIAADERSVYIVLPSLQTIRSWALASSPTWSSRSWSFTQISSSGVLHFDPIEKQLLYTNAMGNAYKITLPSGQLSKLTSDLGFVHAIASDRTNYLFGTGGKVLFYSRADNAGENPPNSVASLNSKLVSGVVVDSSNAIWIADFYGLSLTGPIALN